MPEYITRKFTRFYICRLKSYQVKTWGWDLQLRDYYFRTTVFIHLIYLYPCFSHTLPFLREKDYSALLGHHYSRMFKMVHTSTNRWLIYLEVWGKNEHNMCRIKRLV
jgi:hypothetical protein